MNKRPFQANSWLSLGRAQGPTSDQLSTVKTYNDAQVSAEEFAPKDFLIPGWKGESLISRPAIYIKKIQEQLRKDALSQFRKFKTHNKSRRQVIHAEFMDFAKSKSFNLGELEQIHMFWVHLENPKSQYKEILESFADLYSFRAITIYIYKIKFIVTLASEVGVQLTQKNILNPSFFLGNVFKRGSSKELICESLQTNSYSWYRPSSSLFSEIENLALNFHQISTSEMMKLSTYRPTNSTSDFKDESYAHSLSHKAFGLFLNNLLVFFPIWQKTDKFSYPKENKSTTPDVLNTKFVGNNLTSFSQSHWLAQQENVTMKWSEIICPDFSDETFECGTYVQICQELQFLTFLLSLAKYQNHNSIDLICRVMKEKYSRSKEKESGQFNLFSKYETKKELIYERVVLNVSDAPKKNPHHYLLQKIQGQEESLDPNGYIYVLSNQKLFVPSQSNKIEQLLKKFKLEASFSFEELKGKGEVPNYLYILTKRDINAPAQNEFFFDPFGSPMSSARKVEKESCFSFRCHGELSVFNKFHSFVDELHNFFSIKSVNSTVIYQKDICEKVQFEFHQDAILEGKLLSTTKKGSDHITHPTFFKNLTKTCSPLDKFFLIEGLSPELDGVHSVDITSNLLGIQSAKEDRFPYLLIVDYSNPGNIRIELTSMELYRAKVEQYGMAFFQYFGLLPKRNQVNINLFREFFCTDLGNQVIQLSLNGGYTKLKAKVSALLIPNFIGTPDQMPNLLQKKLSVLQKGSDELIQMDPTLLKEEFQGLQDNMIEGSFLSPWSLMGMLTNFKHQLIKTEQKIKSKSPHQVEKFRNPMIIESLLKLDCKSVYPQNDEVFLDFQIKSKDEIHLPLTQTLQKSEGENCFLEVYSNEKLILKVYSEASVLQFMKFILESATGNAISSVIPNIQVPLASELESVLERFEAVSTTFDYIQNETYQLISNLLQKQIQN